MGDVRLRVEASPYGFALVVAGGDILVGRLRRTALDERWEHAPSMPTIGGLGVVPLARLPLLSMAAAHLAGCGRIRRRALSGSAL